MSSSCKESELSHFISCSVNSLNDDDDDDDDVSINLKITVGSCLFETRVPYDFAHTHSTPDSSFKVR
jgi:hypothetical protein